MSNINKKTEKKRETSWYILTSENLNGINTEEKESLDNQDNQENDDYAWEDM